MREAVRSALCSLAGVGLGLDRFGSELCGLWKVVDVAAVDDLLARYLSENQGFVVLFLLLIIGLLLLARRTNQLDLALDSSNEENL